jgi:hypothetical protein
MPQTAESKRFSCNAQLARTSLCGFFGAAQCGNRRAVAMTNMHLHRGYAAGLALSAAISLTSFALPATTSAFCGFYVTGADQSLYANATMVVLMRDGTRTVLSMQNNYQGPPESFALVIPVPTVLQKEQVKVLPNDVFSRVDTLGAPRLVEYWEQDPCFQPPPNAQASSTFASAPATGSSAAGSAASAAVRIEAQFAVGEYDVVVLSADDSSSLDTWLRENEYNIPEGAEPVLAPYVASGMKFFVAKVDVTRVKFNGNQAALSPLRFHYDTPEFSLPVRLGLLNSQGTQDLIVNVLATKRYELANYSNVAIPTNIRVRNEVRDGFASFYEALFSRTIEQNPNTVVTEYSWSAGSCDPCPTPPLTPQDIATLGGDVLQEVAAQNASFTSPFNFTLTRLHARYTKDNLGEDLIFQPAAGITGGQGMPDQKGALDQPVRMGSGDWNSFQGRYVILHPWEKTLTCSDPVRGRWGGPPAGVAGSRPQAPANSALTGTAPAMGDLPALLAESLPGLSVTASSPLEPLPGLPISADAKPARGIVGTSRPPASTNTSRPPANTGTPPLPAGTTTSPSSSSTAPRDDGGLCSAAPGRSAGSSLAIGLLTAVVAFAARRRRSSAGGAA